ncbi:hypothetical protein FIBSPDRAFT_895595 [Athelia psychrophila]|uniref:Uncharacterized protein n=1 Tax=Athelia psychrophila TaxID=1759441 RepID=A0A166EHR8_9AGAM|nr:hypothetical protein FIBSPDRAFT_895595 [Fibularhizoctonia sp. CBS 109695]
MSYLRRVPELADMARRVVKAEVAIVKLYEEGSVVLFDGPAGSVEDLDAMNKTSLLWKANTSTLTAADSIGEEDPGYASNLPPDKEETSISLTPVHLAPCVEKAVRSIMSRPPAKGKHQHSLTTRPPGPTKEEIATYMKCTDAYGRAMGKGGGVGDRGCAGRAEERIGCGVWGRGGGSAPNSLAVHDQEKLHMYNDNVVKSRISSPVTAIQN